MYNFEGFFFMVLYNKNMYDFLCNIWSIIKCINYLLFIKLNLVVLELNLIKLFIYDCYLFLVKLIFCVIVYYLFIDFIVLFKYVVDIKKE